MSGTKLEIYFCISYLGYILKRKQNAQSAFRAMFSDRSKRCVKPRHVRGCVVVTRVHRLTTVKQFIGGEYDQVDEELKELNEGHDGEAEPQTKHTTGV